MGAIRKRRICGRYCYVTMLCVELLGRSCGGEGDCGENVWTLLLPWYVELLGFGYCSHAICFFFSLAERAITAVPVTALLLEAIVTSSAMPRFHQAESNNKGKQNKQQPSKTNNATPTRHKPKTKHLSGN